MENWTIAIIATGSAFISALMALLVYLQSRELVLGNVGILEVVTDFKNFEDRKVVEVIFNFRFENIGKRKVIFEELKMGHINPKETTFEIMETFPPLNQMLPGAKVKYFTSFFIETTQGMQEQEVKDLATNSLWEHILIMIYKYSCKGLCKRKNLTGKYYYEIRNNCNLFYLTDDKYRMIENILQSEFKRDR